jgi:hypothetical protein
VADAIDRVEARVRAGSPEVRLIFMEPDLFRPERQDAPQRREDVEE